MSGSSLSAQYQRGKYLQEGKFELGRSNYTEAIEKLSIAIRFEPRLYDGYFFRAIAKYELDDYKGAEQDLSVAIDLYPYDFRYFLYRGIIRSKTYNLRGALWDYNKAIRLDSNQANIYVNRAVLQLSLREYEKVLEDCEKAIKLKFRDKDIYLIRGTTFQELERYEEAIQDFNWILKKDSNNVDALIHRGVTLQAIGRTDSALSDLNRVIEMDSSNVMGYFHRGNIYLDNKDFKDALEDYNISIGLSDRNSTVYFNRAIAHNGLKNYRAAEADLDIVLEKSPNNIMAYYNRGGVRLRRNQLKSAEADFDKAIQLYPKYADAYYSRSLVRRRLKKTEEAEQDYKMAGYLQSSGLSFSKEAGLFETGEVLKLTRLNDDFRFDEEAKNNQPQYRITDVEFKAIFISQFDPDSEQEFRAFDGRKYKQSGEIRLIPVLETEDSDVWRDWIHKLDSLAKVNPYKLELQMRLGVVQALAASYNEAFSTLDKVIEQDSSQFMFWFERANARLQLSKYLYSISPIQDPFNSDGKEEEEVDFLAEHYGKMIRDYTKVLRLAPEFSYAWYNRAYGRALSGDFEGAVRDLTQAIRYNPSMAEAFYNRGIMSVLFVGNPSIGCSDLSEAGEMGITEAYAIIKKNCNP